MNVACTCALKMKRVAYSRIVEADMFQRKITLREEKKSK